MISYTEAYNQAITEGVKPECSRATQIWFESLKKEYPDVSDEIFNYCYNKIVNFIYEQPYTDNGNYSPDDHYNAIALNMEIAIPIARGVVELTINKIAQNLLQPQ